MTALFNYSTVKKTSNYNEVTPQNKSWKILIADDDDEIHKISKLVLKEIVFEGERLEFISTHSGKETIEVLNKDKEIAIILLDVVMEEDTTGLNIVKYIRDDLKNQMIRIILRTGQPGQAPEKNVINNYDINDYKEKTELTYQKLFTCVLAALRSYRDLKIIEKSKRTLEEIIKASRKLFLEKSLESFTKAVISQLTTLLKMGEEEFYLCKSELRENNDLKNFYIIVCDKDNEAYVKKYVSEIVNEDIYNKMQKCLREKTSVFYENEYIAYFNSTKETEEMIYFRGTSKLSDFDKTILEIFSNDVVATYENLLLNREIISTQKELIMVLGEVVENRSKETANHVKRVTEYSSVIAKKMGMSNKDVELLRMTVPMHDVGKIGIPDIVLNKPAKLTKEEFEIVKNHAVIGNEILRVSNKEIFETAALIAYQHHERWDGTGYPRGLKNTEIHIFARITAIADVFDALSHKRVYKHAWPIEDALQEIKNGKGTQFDPEIVDVFFQCLDSLLKIYEL